ncbi:hypothetical protein [Jannaschia pohangensis]|uniref:Uncharacterized protein n=1 Tax=Jannaschia pohangensis TaxID=390807 RepID=A0A1I3HYL1_9RHOB|nr:hypothetical protein [Jannaschia pohangensis]SFI40771.1 hypothetical protein SAMN04488095_0750 [Jannaschia pohangensis]
MNDPTDDYFIVLRDREWVDDAPRFAGFVTGNDWTADRMYDRDPISRAEPMLFEIDERELRLRDNVPGEIGHWVVSGGEILVSAMVAEVLARTRATGWELVPSILRTIHGDHAEPIFYLHFMEGLDLWDRSRSEYGTPFDPEIDFSANLSRIRLDPERVAPLLLQDRQLFLLDGVGISPVLLHRDLVETLLSADVILGARLMPLADYGA